MQLCQQFPRAVKRPFHLICSGWCSSAVFVSLSPSLNAVADVAVSSTLLAIICSLCQSGDAGSARICREAGGRVRTNVLVRAWICPNQGGGCTEVGSRSGRSATSWGSSTSSEHHFGVRIVDGTPRRNAALEDGVALKAAKRKKVRAYPELVNSRAQLVVLAVEVGGPSETRAFLSQLGGHPPHGTCLAE